MANDFKCAICLELFKEPKILPCCHSFCKSCLKGIVEKSTQRDKLSCPQCRAVHSIPGDGVEGYPTDYSIPVHETIQPSACTCCQCDTLDPPQSFCSNCAGALCQFCLQAHKRIKIYQEHVIVPFISSDVPSKVVVKYNVKIPCRSHPQELLNVYCKSCNILICCECLVAHHQTHELATVNDETRQEVQGEISQLLEQSTEKHNEMELAKEYIESVEGFLLEKSEDLKKTINTTYEKVFATLKRKQMEQLTRAEAICSGGLKTLWSEKDYVDQTCIQLQSVVNLAERNLKCSNIELLQMSTQVISRLKELNAVQWDETKLERIEFTASEFKSVGNNLDVGEITTLTSTQAEIRLQIESIPSEIPLAKTLKVAVHQCIHGGLQHPVGFQLPSVSATVLYGATRKKLSDTNLHVSRKKWGQWEVSFTPICGGSNEISIFMIGHEKDALKQTIKVIGRPWTNARVTQGPDVCVSVSKLAAQQSLHSEVKEKKDIISTGAPLHYQSVTGEGRVRNSYYPFGHLNNTIFVEWDVGGSCIAYRWGHYNCYDIEIVI